MKANEDGRPVTRDCDISVSKIIDAFEGMGFSEESRVVKYFL